MDLLYITGSNPDWGEYEELKYSLRSYEENYKNLGRVFIVGKLPKWSKGINYIDMDDIYGSHVPGNIISKIIRGCLTDISDDFVFSADDYFVLKSINDEVLNTTPTWGDYSKTTNYNRGYYAKVLKNTIDYLKSKNLPSWNFEAHTPYIINKKRFAEIMISHPYIKDLGFTSTTVYFNVMNPEKRVKALKVATYLNKRNSYQSILEKVEGKTYANINGGTVTPAMKKFLQERYKNKSKWEK